MTTEDTELAEAIAYFRARDPHFGLHREDPAQVHAATIVRAVLARPSARSVSADDAHTGTVTEWRAFGSPPADAWDLTGQGYVGESQVAAQTSALVMRRCGYADVRVESRTVTTSRRESEWKAADQ